MAPLPPDLPDNEEFFLDELQAYHDARGTHFEREPKVAGRPISLLKLYKLGMENGGYDALSAERMRWRSLVKHFGFGNHHEAAMTFQLKTVYYKNLAAYEISTYWKEIPPPPEILENLTAKGGDLRNRTLENFHLPHSRESGILAEGLDSAEDEQRTPKGDAMEVDEPGSGGRYPSRQLRHDPKKTQLYQPDVAPARQRLARTTSSPQASPAPVPTYNNASADPRNAMFNLDRYEPRPSMALTLRSVITPGNNPDVFRQRKAILKAQNTPKPALEVQHLLRGSIPNGMSGPNIYIRCLYGLRSGIPDEQDFALHHLVKVSFERGDKYKFEGFPLLGESLLEKALQITELIYGVTWEISYDEAGENDNPNTLNGSYGTARLLEKINALEVKISDQDVETKEFSHRLDKLNEAALVIRNMVILEENAAFISRFPLLREFLIIAINLPDQPRLTEYRRYALEIAEQVTRFWEMPQHDPLYSSLLGQLNGHDRGALIPAMRAIIRISLECPTTHRLTSLPLKTVERVTSFLLLEVDDDLTATALDFLYPYSAVPENLDFLLKTSPQTLPSLTMRLSNLLLHSARPFEERIMVKAGQKLPANTTIPTIPHDLYRQLLSCDEPERSSRWLRCCFEESPQDDITQIAIWQAYQGRFHDNQPIPAADFIKNVSNTFSTANAQVINGPQPRFIIKGIRPKRVLVGMGGEPHIKCLWEVPVPKTETGDIAARPSTKACGQWQSSRQNLWSHILIEHLGLERSADGRFLATESGGPYSCHWSGCLRFPNSLANTRELGLHVRLHMSDPKSDTDAPGKSSEMIKEPEYARHTFYSTPVDEKGTPAGIAWMSVMIMRNLARYANRQQNQGTSRGNLVDEFFGHVRRELWHNVAVSKILIFYLHDLMKMIGKNEALGQDAASHASFHGTKDVVMG